MKFWQALPQSHSLDTRFADNAESRSVSAPTGAPASMVDQAQSLLRDKALPAGSKVGGADVGSLDMGAASDLYAPKSGQPDKAKSDDQAMDKLNVAASDAMKNNSAALTQFNQDVQEFQRRATSAHRPR